MMARDLARVHAGRRWPARGREVDRHDAHAELLEALAQVEKFASLGVESACDIGGTQAARGNREVVHLRRCGWHRRRSRPRGGGSPGRGNGRWCRRRDRHASVARDVDHRCRGAAGVPAIEAAHAARRRLFEVRHVLRMRAPHRQHLHRFFARARHHRDGLADALVALLLVPTRAHAEQPLLQIAVGEQVLRRQFARDAAVDHHADAIGDFHRDAEVLLDQQHRDLAAAAELAQRLDDLLRRSPAPSPRSARPSRAGAARAAARARSRASAARRPTVARRRAACAPRVRGNIA